MEGMQPREREGDDLWLRATPSEKASGMGPSFPEPLREPPSQALSSLCLALQELQKYEQFIFADHTSMIHVENVYEEILQQSLLDETLKGEESSPGAGGNARQRGAPPKGDPGGLSQKVRKGKRKSMLVGWGDREGRGGGRLLTLTEQS